ncbi:hypothetical protein II906_07780, partial [bacterium]|nr:hypothetical protein [bacterium]
MKKLLFITLLIPLFFLTGCIKNYANVEEYANAMTQVKNNLKYYTIEAVETENGKTKKVKGYFDGNRWKTDFSLKGKPGTILFDGENVWTYGSDSPYAIGHSNFYPPVSEIDLFLTNNTGNPLFIIIHWDKMLTINHQYKLWTLGRITKKNSYVCRMLVSKVMGEMCVSDKYGIPVYSKIRDYTETGDVKYTEINVTSISNEEISQK